jgi:hypothetical protein
MDKLDIVISDPDDIATDIALTLAASVSPEDLFAPDGANGWRGHLMKPYIVRSVKWARSSKAQGIGFYAIVSAVTFPDGEPVTLTCGAVGVCIQLARGLQMGWFDKPVMLRQSDTETATGGRVLKLVRA